MPKNDYTLGSVNMNTKRGGGPGGRMRAAEKPKDFKSAWKMIIGYCKRYSLPISMAFACAIAGVVFEILGPDRLSQITDLISDGMYQGSVDTSAVLRISILVGCFYLVSAVLSYIQNFLMINVTQKISKNMRTEISSKLNRIPLSRYDSASFGDVLSRVTNDVDTISDSLNHTVAQLISSIATFILCIIMMLRANIYLAVAAVASSIIGFVGMRIIIRVSQKFFVDRQKYLGAINGHIEEVYAGHTIVKAYNGEDDSKREFDKLNYLLYVNNWISQFLSGIMMPLMEFVGNFGYVVVCVAGALMTKNGLITFGTIVAFIVYVKLFTQPMGQVAQAATSLQSAAAAAERVFSFLNEPEMSDESEKPDTAAIKNGHVIFRNVKFGYNPARPIIHDFSVDISPGEKVAIVGPTGAGKTTLVNLLMRFYELDGGSISVDGIKTTDITRRAVHSMFCMVLQDTWLFEGTIRDNIAYSKKNVTDEEIQQACQSVGISHYINSLPDGYNTMLGDDDNMSTGQRQLMTIARAMVSDAPLLILDEATSSVDTRTEQTVQAAMDKLTKGRTSFTIAHRLSTIRNADIILVMKDGDIVESGNHEELLKCRGFYADLWQSQFVNAETI
jgi:ATP-binding cassette subfamily B multidrug efflux pump